MTKPNTAGHVIEAAARPDLLAPGTVTRPTHIDPVTWSRMPWPAKWRIAKREPARLAHLARIKELERLQEARIIRRRLAAVLDEPEQRVVIPIDPPDVIERRRQ